MVRPGALCAALLLAGVALAGAAGASEERAAQEQVLGSLGAAQAAPQQEESYQRVYEAFTRLVANVSNNSLGNARRLVSRLTQLVGAPEPAPAPAPAPTPAPAEAAKREQRPPPSEEQRTEQILQRLDQVDKQTDPHTLRQLQEDVNRLVGSLSESYLRNVRRLIDRLNRTVAGGAGGAGALHQSADRLEGADGPRQPGFPGWDELIVAVDRVQKSLANFVRSSTKLITSGRR